MPASGSCPGAGASRSSRWGEPLAVGVDVEGVVLGWGSGRVVVGERAGEQAEAPGQGLGLVDVEARVVGAGSRHEGVEVVAAGEGLVDGGDQGGPPGAGLHRRAPLLSEPLGEGCGPGGRQGGVGVEVVRDGWGEVPADPPPQRGRGVVVGQRCPCGGAQQGMSVDAGAGDGGEPLGQLGQIVVASDRADVSGDGGAPLGQGG